MMTTGTEIAARRPQGQAAAIPAKLAYASELANSGLLPVAYRRNPANVLWAVEYGEMLGLPPMAAMTGVHVIEGKPTASAGLISGLVRQAGHKLRVWGDNKSATCEITRSDDPEHVFSVTWTLRREPGDNPSAEVAGLLNKTVWKQYPASMLKSRAITQCARDACEEVLYGLHYTPEELGAEVNEDGEVVDEQPAGPPAPADPHAGEAHIALGLPGTPAPAPASEDDSWYVRPSPEQEWLAAETEKALTQPTLDACKEAWQTSVKHVNDGKLTKEEVASLQNRLRARIKELQDAQEAPPAEAPVIEGTVLPGPRTVPFEQAIARLGDSPWADTIRDIPDDDTEQARRLFIDAGEVDMDAAKRNLVRLAILIRFPEAGDEAQAAA